MKDEFEYTIYGLVKILAESLAVLVSSTVLVLSYVLSYFNRRRKSPIHLVFSPTLAPCSTMIDRVTDFLALPNESSVSEDIFINAVFRDVNVQLLKSLSTRLK